MQTVSNAWKEAQLQNIVPESYVEISYRVADPSAEADASLSDNGHEDFSDLDQVMDSANKTYFKYATLERNIWLLDGSFGLLPPTTNQNTGYVGNVLSATDKTFSQQPVLTIDFTQTFSNLIPGITIQWSTAFHEYAASFVVTAYNGNAVVATKTVTDNMSVTSFVEMDIQNYNKIEIVIVSWCLPSRRARVEEIVIGAKKVFEKSNLISYDHSMFVDLLSLDLPKAEIVFEISNVEGEWNPDNPQGIFKYLLERQELNVRYGYKLNDAIEWISAGVFYMSEWDTPQNGITATFTARDALEYMGNPFQGTSGTFTLEELATSAFQQSGLPTAAGGGNRWIIDPSLSAISVELPDDFSYTCAEVVQLCANAACCVFYQDREGMLHVEPLADILTDYVINEFNSYSNAEYTISKELQSVNVNDGMGMAENISSGEIQTISNPLIQTETVAGNVAAWVKDILANRKTLSGEYRSDPRLDALDKITVTNKYASNTVFITNVRYSYNGAFQGSYEGRAVIEND